MRNKKGFTLVELLAVIAILAIVLVIAIPKVQNLIEDSHEKTFRVSSYEIVKAAKYYCLTQKVSTLDFSSIIFTPSNGKLANGEKTLSVSDIDLVGDSFVEIDEDCNVRMSITNGRYYASKEYDEVGVLVALGEDAALTRDQMTEQIETLQADVASLTSQVTTLTGSNTTNQTSIAALTDKTNSGNVFLKVYPVGSIFMSKESANPSTLFGGTWVAWGTGRVPVGINTSDTSFDTVEETGGEKTHILTIAEMPSHIHSSTSGTLSWVSTDGLGSTAWLAADTGARITAGTFNTDLDGVKATWMGNGAQIMNYTGSDQSHNNLQPYITVYMWKRTA